MAGLTVAAARHQVHQQHEQRQDEQGRGYAAQDAEALSNRGKRRRLVACKRVEK